jgi:hypothetical protein
VEHVVKDIVQAVERGLLPSTERLQRNAAGTLVVTLLSIICILSLFATGWFAVDQRSGPIVASASVAGAAFVLSLVAWGILAALNRKAAERLEARRRVQAAQAPTARLAAMALTELPLAVQASPLISVLSIAGITYALMKSRRS